MSKTPQMDELNAVLEILEREPENPLSVARHDKFFMNLILSQVLVSEENRLVSFMKGKNGKARRLLIDGVPMMKLPSKRVNHFIDLLFKQLKHIQDKLPLFVSLKDWTKILGPIVDTVDEAEIKLPFPDCLFCFNFDGKSVLVRALQEETKISYYKMHNLLFDPYTQYDDWRPVDDPVYLKMVYACCIAMETDLAVSATPEQITAAYGKNRLVKESKVLEGKSGDIFRILSLHEDPKPTSSEDSSESAQSSPKRRLHYRRGHWRHYSSGEKIWIKWMLVGSPELGTVHKAYTL